MVALTFPTARAANIRQHPGLDIAERHLALARQRNGRDGARMASLPISRIEIEKDARRVRLARRLARAELIRHDAAMCSPKPCNTMAGHASHRPVIDNGFYYDFFRNDRLGGNFPVIENKSTRSWRATNPSKEVWDREKTRQVFRDKGECSRSAGRRHPQDQQSTFYGRVTGSTLPRPHMTSVGKVGNAFS